jgi:cyclophilin family peptidyl-prolyl cis-trans isomerase
MSLPQWLPVVALWLSLPAVGLAQEGSTKPEASSKPAPAPEPEVAIIESTMGRIVFEFHADCPKTAANFKKLASEKFYDGTTFHRVIPGFVIQGGDPNSKDADRSNDGQGGPGYTIPAEIKHTHKRGSVATARLPDSVNPRKESSGSQFYIAVKALPQLDGNYTVFAEVIEGMDVVDKIVLVRTEKDNPIDPVVMKTVRVEKLSAYKKAGEKSAKTSGE